MKILLVSDVECPALWDHFRPDRVEGVELIISCGDLKHEYLEFLVTMINKPLLYVPGNHDVRYITNPPEGCESIDDCVFTYKGIRIGGLGGCREGNGQTCPQVPQVRQKSRRTGHLCHACRHDRLR